MNAIPTSIPEVLVIEPNVFGDERGFFMESWNEASFNAAVGAEVRFVQDNHSRSVKNVLRGLHYQLYRPQGKLVRVVAGSVLDVVVDFRASSDTFKKWVAVELSADNKRQLWVPEGFAHGFLVLSDAAELVYKTTDFYHPPGDRSVAWNDPELAINWSTDQEPTLSDKDKNAPRLNAAEIYD